MPSRIPVAPRKALPFGLHSYLVEIISIPVVRIPFVIRLITIWYHKATNLVADGRALRYDSYQFGSYSIRAF